MKSTMPFHEFIEINPRVRLSKGEEYPFVEMAEVDPKRKYANGNITKIFSNGGAKFEAGDTLFARITPCLENGKIAQFKGDQGTRGFGSTEFFVFRAKPNISDPDYVYYLCITGLIRLPAEKSMSGASGRQRADIKSIENIIIPTPSIEKQQDISSTLGAYDDLIENNLRRIQILEEMAQNLYREWFVKFRFPGHKHVKMIGSKLGDMPEGWEIKALADVAEVNERSLKKYNYPDHISYIDIASVSRGSIAAIQPIDFSDAPGRARRIVKHGDIIWSMVRPNLKAYALIIEPEKNLIVSTGFAVITPKQLPFAYLYLTVTTADFIGYLVNHATGSAYPAVNGKDFENALIICPANNLLEKFNSCVEPLLIDIYCLHRRNIVLRAMRDLLIPKYLNGKG